MPKITEHPGVTIVPPSKIGYPFQLSFKHPLLEKQVKRSSRTTDGAEARRLAIALSAIVRDPDKWRRLPDTTPEVIRHIWQGDVIDQAVLEAIDHVDPVWQPDMSPGVKAYHDKKTTDTIKKIYDENRNLRDQVSVLKAKNTNLVALLRKLTHDAVREYAPKPLSQAIDDFLSDDKKLSGTNAAKRKKDSVRSRLTRFMKTLSEATPVHEITPEQVITHLAEAEVGKFSDGKKLKYRTVRMLGQEICAMLEHQTQGMFRKQPVRQWMKMHLQDDEQAQAAPYWLDQKDVNKLLKHMPPFWRDVAQVQWEGGFRPEELCHLQQARCEVGKEVRIEVDAIRQDGVTYWKPKTKNSYGKVHLRDSARKTVKQILRRKGFLLFPNDPALHHGSATGWNWKHGDRPVYSDFQRRNQLWVSATVWTQTYLKHLRAAARKAGLDSERLDGRTLRRSAGKRILLASKYNLELTAACLRDTPATVRAHYARLLPEDVKQPERK